MDTHAAEYAARLWLQTDAAFGVREVPLVLRKPAVPAAAPPQRRSGAAVSVPDQPAQRAVPPKLPVPRRNIPAPGAEAQRAAITQAAIPASENQGVDIWNSAKLPPIPDGYIHTLSPIADAEKPELLAKLQQQVVAALAPYLSDIATKVVFGDGNPAAKLMFVGEGPGIEEDKTGIPFVGRSGQLLDKMIIAMGLNRQTVYIGNVVKLRAAERDPDTGRLRDRPPTPEEVALNIPWLHKQIEIIRPHIIVTLGAPALKYLSDKTDGISRLRGTWLTYRGIALMPTYHPSFLLRAYTPENRAKVWSDLQQVMEKLGLKPAAQK
jgi:DNA polymerase